MSASEDRIPLDFHVVCVQTEPVFGRVTENLDQVEAELDGRRADLVVLPELFATGYSFRDREELLGLAESFPDGPTVQRIARWSRRTEGMVIGGFVERAEGRVFNAAAVAVAGRPLLAYRKVHLFGFEPDYFDAGDRDLPVVEHAGVKVGVMICFDWIFPEAARCLALAGADVIAHPSNLVLQWCQRAMPTRALENGVFAVTCNRVGREHRPPRPELGFTGHSVLVSPLGEVLVEGPGDEAAVLSATFDISRARDKSVASGNDRLLERRPAFYSRLVEET